MNRLRSVSLILAGFFVLMSSALPATAAVSQRQRITSNPRGVGAQFGNAVAVSGTTMVVGARHDSTTASQAGAAFVYVLNGTTWSQQAKLLADDGAVTDKFGYSVAISGDTIVVGAFNDDSPLSNAGSAYVFVRNGTTWTQQQKLSGAAADQEFGNAVAIIGEVIAVGEHFSDLGKSAEAGAVYIYQRSGTTWTETQKLVPVGGVILGDHFGESLAISGSKLVVGAAGADIPETGAGSVYVFAESGGLYVQEEELSIPDGGNGDNFGFSVAIEGNTLIGGALRYTPVVGQTAYGAAYVFEFDGSTWIPQGRLEASDGAAGDNFGWSVAVSGDRVAVGARGDDTAVGADAGSAYLFTRTGATWTQEQKIEPGDPFNGDRFGASIAFRFDTLVVGAVEKNLTNPNGQGAAYVFKVHLSLLYATGGGAGGSGLYTIDTLTGEATLVWDLPPGIFVYAGGLAYDAATDMLFATGYDNLSQASLYAIDRFTGTTTFIGYTGGGRIEHGGLAIDPTTGDMYATGVNQGPNSGFFWIDKDTGAATLIGQASGPFTYIYGLGFRDDGVLFGNGFADPSIASHLFTVDVATGETPVIGPHGIPLALGGELLSGLAFGADGTLFSLLSINAARGGLYSVDPATGAATLIGDTILSFGVQGGLAFAPNAPVQIPEPDTLALPGEGLAALAGRPRRHSHQVR